MRLTFLLFFGSALRLLALSSGNQSDVQNAVNAAAAGGTVEVPNGNWTWTGTLEIKKPEIANLDFDISNPSDVYIYSIRTIPSKPRGTDRILLHDCNFHVASYTYAVEWGTNGGVIWDCLFDGKDGQRISGINFVCVDLNSDWCKPSSIGTLDKDGLGNTYVEDCTFQFSNTGCMNLDENSRVVLRHNLYDNATIGSHGQETSVS
jgi:hypothetical protein